MDGGDWLVLLVDHRRHADFPVQRAGRHAYPDGRRVPDADIGERRRAAIISTAIIAVLKGRARCAWPISLAQRRDQHLGGLTFDIRATVLMPVEIWLAAALCIFGIPLGWTLLLLEQP